MTDLTPERIAEAISALRDYIDPHATVEGEAVDLLDHTITTQAKEIERLRKYITATAPSKSESKRVISMCGGDE